MSCSGNGVDRFRTTACTDAGAGGLTTRIVGTRDMRKYFSVARDVGLRTLGLRTGGISLCRGAAWIGFPRRYRNGAGGTVCVLGAAAAYAVVVGLNRGRRNATLLGIGMEDPQLPGQETAECGCCPNCFTVGKEEEELHPVCHRTGKLEGLVNLDLLAYLRPYAMFQKRTANLLAVLKGRAILWRRRQRVSEHCFSHVLPGTLVKAMEMSSEEVWALRAFGQHSEACKSVYAKGVDPSQLRGRWFRGGTEDMGRMDWLFRPLKVEE